MDVIPDRCRIGPVVADRRICQAHFEGARVNEWWCRTVSGLAAFLPGRPVTLCARFGVNALAFDGGSSSCGKTVTVGSDGECGIPSQLLGRRRPADSQPTLVTGMRREGCEQDGAGQKSKLAHQLMHRRL